MQERNLWSQVSFRSNWNLEMLVFEKRGNPRGLLEKSFSEQKELREPTTNSTLVWLITKLLDKTNN